MNEEQIKEANRYYWMVKGQLIPEDWPSDQVQYIYDSYFKRLWGNHENCYREDGFNEAWNEREALDKIARLGYD